MAETRKTSARARAARAHVDRLIDWFERNRPEAGKTLTVDLTRDQALTFANEVDGVIMYRGRKLDCAGTRKRK